MKKNQRRIKALLIGCICAASTALSGFSAAAAVVSPVGSNVSTTSPTEDAAGSSVSDPSGGNASGPSAGSVSTGSPSSEGSSGADGPSGSITTVNTASSGGQLSTASGPTLWVVGDSTAAAFNDTNYYSPRYGWGTQLYRYFQGINIQNLAISGTSSKTYPDTEQYQTLVNNMKSGDYVLIGFGHNDERAESGRYSNPNGSVSTSGSLKYNLYEKFIRPARDKGATPILCTPIVRRDVGNNYTGASGHITDTVTNAEGTFQGGDYAKSIQQLGVGKSVTVLNLTARTKDVYERLGADGVKNRHAWTSEREASIDNTHTNLYGAACNAWFIADELLSSNCDLKNYVVANAQPPEYSADSLNGAYQGRSFTAPTGVSSIWPAAGDWLGTAFGDIDGYEYLNNMYFALQPESDSRIRMAVGADSGLTRNTPTGKIAQSSDGIAMYYRAVPAGSSFTLSADVTINSINPTNQTSFGLMVRDDIYLDTVDNDTLGDYVAAGPLMLSSSDPWNCFARKNGTLTSGGTAARTYSAGETLHLEIRKSSDGYTCTFGDNAPVSAGFDFPLTAIDPNYVYVGVFVARSVDVTFNNISLVYN